MSAPFWASRNTILPFKGSTFIKHDRASIHVDPRGKHIKHLIQLWIKRGKNGKLVKLHFMTFEIGKVM